MIRSNEHLIECVKAAGQMLIDNAEDYVGKVQGISDFYIRIDFPDDMEYIPEIEICRTHIPEQKRLYTLYGILDKLKAKGGD